MFLKVLIDTNQKALIEKASGKKHVKYNEVKYSEQLQILNVFIKKSKIKKKKTEVSFSKYF